LGILLEKKSFAASILIDIFSAKGMGVDKVQASIVDFLNQTPL